MKLFDHSFFAAVYATMQDPANLYLVQSYCPGGDLLTVLQNAGSVRAPLSIEKSRLGGLLTKDAVFYIGNILVILKELADKDIAVNAVTPAGAKTRILDQMSKEHVQRMLSKVPRGRFLEIQEFTSLVCWLSSQENTFSTAAVFDISGGRSTY